MEKIQRYKSIFKEGRSGWEISKNDIAKKYNRLRLMSTSDTNFRKPNFNAIDDSVMEMDDGTYVVTVGNKGRCILHGTYLIDRSVQWYELQ